MANLLDMDVSGHAFGGCLQGINRCMEPGSVGWGGKRKRRVSVEGERVREEYVVESNGGLVRGTKGTPKEENRGERTCHRTRTGSTTGRDYLGIRHLTTVLTHGYALTTPPRLIMMPVRILDVSGSALYYDDRVSELSIPPGAKADYNRWKE
ncbi:unnamed protein product, partial [Pleuronectes platessa]